MLNPQPNLLCVKSCSVEELKLNVCSVISKICVHFPVNTYYGVNFCTVAKGESLSAIAGQRKNGSCIIQPETNEVSAPSSRVYELLKHF